MNPILKRLEEGTLIRDRYESHENGKHLACLYVALAGEGGRPETCPAFLMPKWFANLTVWIDDAGTEEYWPDVVRRYAGLSERWGVLSSKDWSLLELHVKRESLLYVLPHAGDSEDVVKRVLELLDRAIAGEVVPPEEWAERMHAAWSGGDGEVEHAARTATRTTAYAAKSVAYAAVRAVGEAQWSAEADAQGMAADKLIDKVLDLLEEVIARKEAA